MAAALANGVAVDEAMFDLHRSVRESPTLPELPEEPSYELLAEAYADMALQLLDRQRRIIAVLDAMNVAQKARHAEVEGWMMRILKAVER